MGLVPKKYIDSWDIINASIYKLELESASIQSVKYFVDKTCAHALIALNRPVNFFFQKVWKRGKKKVTPEGVVPVYSKNKFLYFQVSKSPTFDAEHPLLNYWNLS